MKHLEHICTGIGLGVIIVLATLLNLYTHGVDVSELLIR